MSDRNFKELLSARWDEGKFVCVGLDSDAEKVKKMKLSGGNLHRKVFIFNQYIVDATKDLVCAYKPNLAFYRGLGGKQALRDTIKFINVEAPGVSVILDAKQADIGSSNDGYVAEDFDFYGADAVTVNPYLGVKAMKPFLDRKDKGIIVLCRTSNPGAGEFQDMLCWPLLNRNNGKYYSTIEEMERELGGPVDITYFGAEEIPLYQFVAYRVARSWNYNDNCAVVVGATYPRELAEIREIVGDMPILIPGVGTQGGTAADAVRNGRDSRGRGMIISVSSSIIYASSGPDFPKAARAATQNIHGDITAVLATA